MRTLSLLLMLTIPMLSQTHYKLYLEKDGLYQVTGEELANAGVDIGQINPATLQLFSDGQRILPYSTLDAVPELQEMAIRVVDGGDGQFNSDDYILFYGEAQNRFVWDASSSSFMYITNPYDNRSCYWLLINGQAGKRIPIIDATPISGTLRETYTDYLHLEEDHFNPMKSGLEWSWNLFRGPQDQFDVSFDLPLAPNAQSSILTLGSNRFELFYYPPIGAAYADAVLNGQVLPEIWYIYSALYSESVSLDTANTLILNYFANDSLPRIGFNYLEVEYLRETGLSEVSKKLFFEPATGSYITRYRGTLSGDILLLDVTDPINVREFRSNNSLLFEETIASEARTYWFNQEGAYSAVQSIEPAQRGWILSNSAEYIAIVAEEMEAEIQPLLSHRQSLNGFVTTAITMEEIYNEFGFGKKDPTALRNAIKWMTDNWTPGPRFILLAGGGYYDYRNVSGELPNNWVPTFQVSAPNDITAREVDDYFVDLTYNGSENNIEPEIAMGRLPAATPAELAIMVQKTIDAEINFEPGLWRLNTLLVVDDEFTSRPGTEVYFMEQSEYIVQDRIPYGTRLFKLYETEYLLVGSEKPDATRQLISWMNQGNRILSYNGHSADSQWTHENLLNVNRDVKSINNTNKTGLLLSYSHIYSFDKNQPGIARELHRSEDVGIWGAMIPTGPIFRFRSEQMHYRFWQKLSSDYLGEAFMFAKNGSVSSQKYRLLADPAMRVHLPGETIEITSISPDTLKGRAFATITGVVNSTNPTGMLWLEVREPGEFITRENLTYESTGAAIFRGKVPIVNGTFLAQFVVPEDVNSGEVAARGKIHAYSWNGSEEGMGFADSIVVGGLAPGINDNTSPQLSLVFEGDSAGNEAYLVADLSDDSGINLSELGSRHPALFIDGNRQDSLFVGDFFTYNEGSYTSGTLRYPLPYLSNGSHSVTLEVYDNYNNFATDSLSFTITGIEPQDQLPTRISLGANYPNPFNPATTIPFTLSGGKNFLVRLDVYNILGQRVATLLNKVMPPGEYLTQWNGRNDAGEAVASGLYYYRLQAGNHIRSAKMILLK
ncbi:MAG: type IX secretion system sortase PorU [Calditrichia bacterium]